MELVTLYRVACVQDPTRGPFTQGSDLEIMCREFSNPVDYPAPEVDPGIMVRETKRQHCACSSVRQLQYWFNRENVIRALLEMNAQVYILNVPKEYVVLGEAQALFVWEHAQIVATHPIEALPTLGEDHEQTAL